MTTRYEKVVLRLEDEFSRGALTAAGSAKVLDKSLNDTGSSSRRVSRDLDQTSHSIDRMSGRLGLAARAVGAFGPAIAPISTAAIPAITGLTAGLGATALGAGAVVLAFQGLGDVMKAVNKAQLEPTTENIEKARAAMAALPPAARRAAGAMQDFREAMGGGSIASAAGFFPGFVSGLGQLEMMAPQVERIMRSVATAAGDLFNRGATALAGPEWYDFISFIEREAAPTLTTFGHTLGNFASGIADLVMAMDPLSDDFLDGLLDSSERFAEWADNLSRTEGYQEFIDYVRETGPQVVETVGSLADALLQIGEAAAPLGGPVLQLIESVADALAAIADSPIGPPILAGVSALSLLSLTQKAFGGIAAASWLQAARGAEGYVAQLGAARGAAVGLGKGAGLIAGMTLATSDFGRELGVSNTAMGATIGMMGGPWGAAIGTGIGALLDITSASKNANAAIESLNEALESGTRGDVENSIDHLEKQQTSLGQNWVSLIPVVGGWAKGLGVAGEEQDELSDAVERGKKALDDFGDGSRAQRIEINNLSNAGEVATASINGLAAAFEHANTVLSGRADMRSYEKAIDDATASLKEHGRRLNIATEAGRSNQAALDAIASTGIKVAKSMQGLDRIRTLRRVRRDFIDTAVKMGMSRDEARALWRELMKVDQMRVNPKIDADTAKARAKAIELGNLFDWMARPRTMVVTTQNAGYGSDTANLMLGPLGPKKKGKDPADGGTIPFGGGTPRRASWGATVPKDGMPYGDRYPYLLAPGEEVISNRFGQADRHRSLLKAINAGRLADGGTAGGDRDGFRELGKAARETAKAMREETKARLDAVKQQRNSLRTAVRDRFRSDIFAAPDSAWGGSGSDWRSRLNADIAQARATNKATATLKRKGLDGNALADLLQNADVSQIKGFASMSKSDLAAYERLYRTRDRVSATTGRNAGNAAYGKQIQGLQRSLHRIEKQLAHAPEKTGEAFGDRVNGAGRNGSRRGGRR